jgi:hypothetical protein
VSKLVWQQDGDCFVFVNGDTGQILAAYGPDKSKEGWHRAFAFNGLGVATHEAPFPPEADIRRDIEDWFDADGKMRPHAERTQIYKDREVSERRCLVTKNPCGTDTWAVGQPCQCAECQAYLKESN